MMKKQAYQKPALRVLKFEQQCQLLQTSGGAGLMDYDWNTEPEE